MGKTRKQFVSCYTLAQEVKIALSVYVGCYLLLQSKLTELKINSN